MSESTSTSDFSRTGAGAPRIIDAHHHLWDPADHHYEWMDESTAAINMAFGVPELEAARAPTPVTGTVVVQAIAQRAETRDLLALSASAGPVEGVVGWVDLTAANVGDELAQLAAHPGRLVGIRHQAQAEDNPDWLLRDDVVRGLAAVAGAGLVFDILVDERQWSAALTLAGILPELSLVLDHLGNPSFDPDRRESWHSWLAELARRENVSCKVSGIVTHVPGTASGRELAVSYAQAAIAIFGPDRSMYGSDWPVCLLAADYGDTYDIADAASSDLSTRERAAFLGGTATRVYGLGEGT